MVYYRQWYRLILSSVVDCGVCGLFSCDWDKNFIVTCRWCREQRCLNCFAFKTLVQILVKNGDNGAKNYLQNVIYDYLGISELRADVFNCKISQKCIEKKEQVNYIKNYRKAEKNREQVINPVLEKLIKYSINVRVNNAIFIKKLRKSNLLILL